MEVACGKGAVLYLIDYLLDQCICVMFSVQQNEEHYYLALIASDSIEICFS